MTWKRILEADNVSLSVSDEGNIRIEDTGKTYQLQIGEKGAIELIVNGASVGTSTTKHLIRQVEQDADLSSGEREKLELLKEFVDEWGPSIGLVLEIIRLGKEF